MTDTTRSRVRDRIKQGISLRRSLPSEVGVDELHMAAILRTDNTDAALDTYQFEANELDEAVPQLHTLWDVTSPDVPPPQRFTGRLRSKLQRTAFRLLGPLLRQQAAYNGANARTASVLLNRSIRQGERVDTLASNALAVIGVSLRKHTDALLELERSLGRLEVEVTRLVQPPVDIDDVAFAERFSGTENEVKDRLRRHVPRLISSAEVVDLAAGRGELLELLRAAGVASRGLEASARLVDHCRNKGLPVERRDPRAFLEETEPGSLGGIAALGLLGRLEEGAVLDLVRLASRALGPGGALVLDVSQATRLERGHEYRPEALGWVLEREGFEDVQVETETVSGLRV